MSRASDLLLRNLFNGKPLFSSQLELVRDLIGLQGSPYYTPVTEVDKYHKEFVRLKTYLSQLLSTSVSRSVTEDFKDGLMVAVNSRLTDKTLVSEVVNAVIADLKVKNSNTFKAEQRSTPLDQFYSDIQSARYIAVITMRPLQLDLVKSEIFSIRHFLFSDIIDRLTNSEKDLRQYRFNFPTDAHSQLFWRGFRRIFIEWLVQNLALSMLDAMYSKFTISIETHQLFKDKEKVGLEDIVILVDEVLDSLNHNRYIMVFTSTAPIFSLPMVVLDPSEPHNIKVYTVFENEKGNPAVIKYPDTDIGIWRIFMWDQFKLQRDLTQEKKFLEAIKR